MSTATFGNATDHPSKASIVWSIVMIIGGIVAIAMPLVGSVAGEIFVAWVLLVAGLFHIAVAFSNKKISSFIWKLIVGIVYVVAGGFMLWHPIAGLASLTLVVGILFFIEGIFEIVMYFAIREALRSGWFIVDGIISIILGVLVVANWPWSAYWAVGLLVGVNLLISGIARLALYSALHHHTATTATP